MSWEGYDQIICKNGHLHSVDAYNFYDHEDWKCPDCGEIAIWWNQVNQTNPCTYDKCELPKAEKDICRPFGCNYIKLEEATPPEFKICNLGYTHCIKQPTYKIPKGKGHLVERKEE